MKTKKIELLVNSGELFDRVCSCPTDENGAAQICYDCAEPTEETENCPNEPCPFSDWTDPGNCVYHSSCCETIRVSATTGGQLTGYYSRIYVENIPYAVYKRLTAEGETQGSRYIHWQQTLSRWVFSDKYWSETNQEVYVYARDEGFSCPSDMRHQFKYHLIIFYFYEYS